MNNPHTRDLLVALARLNVFADLVEEMLERESEALGGKLDVSAQKYPEEERGDFYAAHAEDIVELSDDLPTILRYAVLTSADSAVEQYLVGTAKTFAEVNSPRVQLVDFTGTGFRRAHQYLLKVAEVDFPESLPEWTAVLRLRELRNCVVHADGYIESHHAPLARWIESTEGIRISHYSAVTLSKGFTTQALRWCEEFANAFDAKCDNLGLWRSVFDFEDPLGGEQPGR